MPEPATPEPEPEGDEPFDTLAKRLGEGLPATEDPHKTGFQHYKAGEYAKAQPYFALAATRDTVAWKHPFNLACASAKQGDETTARVALVEAVRRGGETVVAKAGRDADLASVRSSAWFQPVLRGEPWAPPKTPDDPAAPAEPALGPPAGGEIPLGSTTKIAAADLAKVIAELTKIHHAKPVVRASLQHPGPGGELVGWAIYEYGRFDACVGGHADKKAGKKACKLALGASPDDEEEGSPGEMECTDQWLVRVSPLASGTIAAREQLMVACAMQKVRRLDALDLDGDGHDEILIDVVGEHSSAGFRDSVETDYGRLVRVLRLDGTTQLELDARWTTSEITPSEAIARRIALRDDDGDGRADLVVQSREFAAIHGVKFADDLWPEGDPSEELGSITTAVWRYDTAKDAWIEPASKP